MGRLTRLGAVTLRLHDTATREVRDFVPLEAGKAGIYVCGLTVQSEPHVGHVRSAVNFDVLRRWLTASGYDVTFIRNVTDIDDKILAKGEAQGRPWFEIAYRMGRELDKALDAINVLPPTYEPAATGHVPEILELIGQLVERGHAYAAEDGSGDVYFDVRSWPAYGELTRQKVDDMEPAEDADPRGKRDPRDFALWKGWKKALEPETAAWPSPYGPGRPGWHIECSAMAAKYLGPAFDIHGGGVDLRFPHHENEMAQSRAAGQQFASVLAAQRVDHHGRREDVEVARQLPADPRGAEAGARHRAALLHGRGALPLARGVLVRGAGRRGCGVPDGSSRSWIGRGRHVGRRPRPCPPAFVAAMDDDLGTPAAVAVIHDTSARATGCLARRSRRTSCAGRGPCAMLDVLGLDPADPAWGSLGGSDDAQLSAAVDALVAGPAGRADRRPRREGLGACRRDPGPDRRRGNRRRGHPRGTEVDARRTGRRPC